MCGSPVRSVPGGGRLRVAPRPGIRLSRDRAGACTDLFRAAPPSGRHAVPPVPPSLPLAVRQFDLRGYDLVISSNHCVAKGARVHPGALHICYCYTPMRYIWSQYDDYFGKGRAGLFTRIAMRSFVGPLRRWDVATATHPRHFVAISENIRARIRKIYGRDSDMIYPPVDTSLFTLAGRDDGYYLIVSALVPYKAVDLAIEAFNRSGDRLLIVGEGPDAPRLRKLAGPRITFEGWQPEDRLREYYAGCRAVIFPGKRISALSRWKPWRQGSRSSPTRGEALLKQSLTARSSGQGSFFRSRRSARSWRGLAF